MMSANIILILSDDFDTSTTDVCKWLKFYKQKFIRANRFDNINFERLRILDGQSQTVLKIREETIAVEDLKSYWFRRGKLSLHIPELSEDQLESKIFDFREALKQVETDSERVVNYIYHLFDTKSIALCSYDKRNNNKLTHLKIAGGLGLDTPHTFLETSKIGLVQLLKIHPDGLITKVVSDTSSFRIFINGEELRYAIYTNRIKECDLENLPDYFPLSLFQPLIPKKADIRVFYLNGKFYSMAIMSQADSQTSIDFRRYNYKKPNRSISFKLPSEIEYKLHKFMQKIELNTGSIDLVYGENKKFYFLEVNPVGQFGMVSKPCNYYLEREIAMYLSNA